MQTLCWSCENAVPSVVSGAGCSWSRKLVQVPGCELEAGFIISCPEYCPDGQRKEKKEMGKRTWDEKKARELLDSGMAADEVAKALGTATANIKHWKKNNYAVKEHPAALPAEDFHDVEVDTPAHKEAAAPVPVPVAEESVPEDIVEPRKVWEARRLKALISGILLQMDKKKALPIEWVEEFNQLVGGETYEQLR